MKEKLPPLNELLPFATGFPITIIPAPGEGKRIYLHADGIHYEIVEA
jgi:hypothetical protein